jgi:hypothetical protein
MLFVFSFSAIVAVRAPGTLKVVFKELPANTLADLDTVLQRMMEVETSVDPGPEDLVEPIGRALKHMCVNAV